MNVQGSVVWNDLNTSDIAKASSFYSELFGWEVREEGHWNLIYARGNTTNEHFGAMMKLRPEMHAPPHWIPYFAVNDLEDAMAKVKANGGALHTSKMSAGTTGEFAVAGDPQGAAFVLWQYKSDTGKSDPDGMPPPGKFVWDELMTSDVEGAKKFYSAVIGWEAEDVPMPGMTYTLWNRPGTKRADDGKPKQGGGLMALPPGVPHPFWSSYVAVADCDASAARAKELGATVVMPPTDIPNVGRFATLIDPTGAAISILAAPKS
jgi:predicted enzyme related to lactoylglutathione lyase